MNSIAIRLDLRGDAIDLEWHRLARRAGYRAAHLAELSGVSLRTLQRHFRGKYGMTVTNWIHGVRMREAAHRIESGEGVKSIAFDLGYKQLSHFSREFKKAYGAPPSQVTGRKKSFAMRGTPDQAASLSPARA